MSEQTTINEFDKKRNELIKSLDEANFLVKYGYDVTLDKDKPYKSTLSGYTYNLIYDQYKSCIDYIKDNTSKLYEPINNMVDYNNPVITSEILGSIISTLLSGNGLYTKESLMKVFEVDKTIFDDNTIEKLNKKLTSFVEAPDEVKFKFKTMKTRKDSKPVSFNIVTTEEITDPSIKEQVTNLFLAKVPIISGKLNYYRNGS